MKRLCLLLQGCCILGQACATDLVVRPLHGDGMMSWSNAFTNGVCTVLSSGSVTGSWRYAENYFTTGQLGWARAATPGTNRFLRLLSVDISTNAPDHFTNLVNSYGILETVAGKGQSNADHVSFWKAAYEGSPATNANHLQAKGYLPRAITMDRVGNLIPTTSEYGLIRRINFRRIDP